jgi:hypothetical protein
MADSSTVNSNNNNTTQQEKATVYHSSFGFIIRGSPEVIEAARATDEQMKAAILNGQKRE